MSTSGAPTDHLIRPQQKRLRNGEAERFGHFEVDHETKRLWQLDRQVSWLRAAQDLIDVSCTLARQIQGSGE